MSNAYINDPRIGLACGFKNAFEFWAFMSGQATGTLYDHANYYLTTKGYTGTLDDKFNAWLGVVTGVNGTPMDRFNALVNAPYASLQALGGLTFYKDISNTSVVNADYSVGSPALTFARSTNVISTYFDANGVMQSVADTTTKRNTKGFIDETGFKPCEGILVEKSSKNYIKSSLFPTDGGSGLNGNWNEDKTISGTIAYSLVDVKSKFNVGATVNAQRLVVSGATANNQYAGITNAFDGDAGDWAQNDWICASVYVKGTVTNGKAYVGIRTRKASFATIAETRYQAVNLSATEWTRITVSYQSVSADSSRAEIMLGAIFSGAGGSADLQFACPNLEKLSRATSAIPTSTAMLTRGYEVYKGASVGNRTGAEETIFIEYVTPYSEHQVQTDATTLIDDNGDRRVIQNYGGDIQVSYPNITDDAGSGNPLTGLYEYSTNVIAFSVKYNGNPSDTFTIYNHGILNNTSTTNFTSNSIGTEFYIGGGMFTNIQQSDCIIKKVAIFNRKMTNTEICTVKNILNSKPLIVCMGDSITLGTGSTDRAGYPYLLYNKLNAGGYYSKYAPYNYGFGGFTTTSMKAFLPYLIASSVPTKAVIIDIGINDLTSAGQEPAAVANISDMIDSINTWNSSVDIYVCRLTPVTDATKNGYVNIFNGLLDTMITGKTKTNLYKIDLNTGFDTGTMLGGDGLHPNDTGYTFIADTIYVALQNL